VPVIAAGTAMRHLYLIGYDISDNRSRVRALRAIKGNAIGGQKSVYECWLDDGELAAARAELSALAGGGLDRIIVTRLDPRAAVHTLGVGVAPADGDFFYQG